MSSATTPDANTDIRSSRQLTRPFTATAESATRSSYITEYDFGKNSTSIEASRSSIVTIAQGSPFLFTRRSTEEIIPARTISPSFGASSMIAAIGLGACLRRMRSVPSSGWADTYSPSISRS